MPRSYMSDFMAGVDPTGTSTFQYGMDDGSQGATSGARQAVNTAGGVVGGALAIPALAGGVAGAFRGLAGGKGGGWRSRLLSMGRGAWEGAKNPYTGLYNAAQAKRGLSAVQAGKSMTQHQYNAAKRLLPGTMVDQLPGGIASMGPERASSLLRAQMSPQRMAEMNRALSGEIAAGAGAFGVSGALGGVSAGLQYGKGAQTGEVQAQAQRAQQRSQYPKTAAYHQGFEFALKLAAAR